MTSGAVTHVDCAIVKMERIAENGEITHIRDFGGVWMWSIFKVWKRLKLLLGDGKVSLSQQISLGFAMLLVLRHL